MSDELTTEALAKPAPPLRTPARLQTSAPAGAKAAPHRALEAMPLMDGQERLWNALMLARVMLAIIVLAALLDAPEAPAQARPHWMLWVWSSMGYLAATTATRFLTPVRYRNQPLDSQWLHTCGLDLVYFGILSAAQWTSINYALLMVLPVLTASVLGSRALALGSAILAGLILVGSAIVGSDAPPWENTAALFQMGFTGLGLLAVAWLINHLAQRTAREQHAAHASRTQAYMQTLVNDLVIEAMSDGVLIVDTDLIVRSANPAARQLLGSDQDVTPDEFALTARPSWTPLARIAQATLAGRPVLQQVVNLQLQDNPASRMLVRTDRTAPLDSESAGLCVMFLQDLRAMQAQLRAEKLVSMGRMSAAVAHELRNPLAAISQANALLDEELEPEAQKRLRTIVAQNTKRLQRVVDDILDVSRVPVQTVESQILVLDHEVDALCTEWHQQHPMGARLTLTLQAPHARIRFVREHLHRLLVNLLDNAARYASDSEGAIQVITSAPAYDPPLLCVWSDGAAMEASVQRHLFEPFFSSESRSSGLGLFICRQLCERHDATITYERNRRRHRDRVTMGNEFKISFRRAVGA